MYIFTGYRHIKYTHMCGLQRVLHAYRSKRSKSFYANDGEFKSFELTSFGAESVCMRWWAISHGTLSLYSSPSCKQEGTHIGESASRSIVKRSSILLRFMHQRHAFDSRRPVSSY